MSWRGKRSHAAIAMAIIALMELVALSPLLAGLIAGGMP